MKYFVIIVTNGEYSDQTVNNLFLVETEQVAAQLTAALQEATEYYHHFRDNEQRAFREAYQAKNPEPSRMTLPREPRYQPQAPAHLRHLPKKERRELPEYKAFLKALREYEAETNTIRAAENLVYNTWRAEHEQWTLEYSKAEKQYLDEHLWPAIRSLFPEKYAQLYEHVKCGYDPRFSFQEIEVI